VNDVCCSLLHLRSASSFTVNAFQFLPDLSQTSGCVWEDLVLRDLLLDDLSENYLE
jgi:hypothetical protein